MDSFKAKMPAAEAAVLDKKNPVKKAQTDAKEKNAKAMWTLISGTKEMKDMNKILTDQRWDKKYPTGLSCMVWALLKRVHAVQFNSRG